MNILYFGKICDEELFSEKLKKEEPFFVAQYMFEKALCSNLTHLKDVNLKIISIFQTDYFPKDRLIFRRNTSLDNTGIDYLTFINLPYIREISFFTSTIYQIFIWWIKNKNSKDKYIYSSCHFAPVSLAIVIMGKLFKIKKIVTFTDLSLFTYSDEKVNKMKLYKKIIINPYIKLVNYLQKSYDAYVLFSDDMNTIVNPRNKNYCVIEGMFNSENLNLDNSQVKSNTIVHAGTLNEEVGIGKILDIFDELGRDDIQLIFIGKGDMVDEINRRMIKNKNIKYLGFLGKKEVFEELKKAKLLINLRDPDDKYTKYSFPSKMFEYMVSGTPVITTKLRGIPKEYYKYVYHTENYSNAAIIEKINEIFSKNDRERESFGNAAKEYILSNKNSEKQTGRIIKFIKTI